MQRESGVHILWDASHIWGLMAWRALRALGVPSRLVKAKEIAEGALHGKPGQGARLLLVPGGSAGRKAALLGPTGRKAVRDFVRAGGAYLGFCGGAGLALSPAPQGRGAAPGPGGPDEGGLGLCPWTRAPYELRFQHLVSGHLLARVHVADAAAGASPGAAPISLPVWWPGRFAPENGAPDVTVLATSIAPDADLWLADLPLAGISPQVLETWRNCYGVDLSPDFLAGQPLAVCGSFGRGRYLLSYSHLETPESPAANAWLAHILAGFGIAVAKAPQVPPWELDAPGDLTEGALNRPGVSALRSCARIRALLALGVAQRLFFRRTSWLWGWRAGLPGMACNNLIAAFAALAEAAAARGAAPRLEHLWERVGPRFDRLLDVFADGAESWLMASRLAELLSPTLPHAVDGRGLAHQRQALFGHPMRGGGIAEELLQLAEEGIYAAQAAFAPGE